MSSILITAGHRTAHNIFTITPIHGSSATHQSGPTLQFILLLIFFVDTILDICDSFQSNKSSENCNYTPLFVFVFVVETEELYSTCVSQPPAASVNNIFIFFYCQFHNSSQAARKWQIHVPSRLLTHWLLTIITRKLRLKPRPWAVSSPPLAWFECASLPWCIISCRDPGTPGSNVPAQATSNLQQSCWVEDVSMMRWNAMCKESQISTNSFLISLQ